MSGLKDTVSRRPLLAALGALIGAGVIGGAGYETVSLWHRHREHSAYDDLLAGFDRDDGNVVGQAVIADAKDFQAHRVARDLRRHIGHRPLATVLTEDAAQGRITETQGWVLPATLSGLCALAAKAG